MKAPTTFRIKGKTPETFNFDIIKVGKDPKSHLVIDDDDVSRMHAVIEVGGEDDVTLIDLGNEPGTHVNGARVNKCKISRGDVLLFGSTQVTFLGAGTSIAQEVEEKDEQDQLVANLMETTGCSKEQAKETLANLAQKADNVRWVYVDGKIKRIRLLGDKIEMPDGSRYYPHDIGGFEELEQFPNEWEAMEYGLKREQELLDQAEERVKALQEELRLKPSTYGWRSQN